MKPETLKELGWKKFHEKHAQFIRETQLLPARITSAETEDYRIITEEGEFRAILSYDFYHETETDSDFPVIGDWVFVQFLKDEEAAEIDFLVPRKTKLFKHSDSCDSEKIIAANIDRIFIIQETASDFTMEELENSILFARDAEIEPVIILSKTDLCDNLTGIINEIRSTYPAITTIPVSSVLNTGYDVMYETTSTGETFCLLGAPGAGKSTITKKLLQENLNDGKNPAKDITDITISSADRMYFLKNGAILIDSPELSELNIQQTDENRSKWDPFEDIEHYASECHFKNCRHINEPGCRVLEAIENGEIEMNHLINYRKMREKKRNIKSSAEMNDFVQKKPKEKKRIKQNKMQKHLQEEF